jgi:hypothetical protein
MTIKTRVLFLFLILLISLGVGCSDDVTSPSTDPDTLLTVHFHEYFLPGGPAESLIFASDLQGNLLAEAFFSGETTVVLKNSTVHPDSISFTIVTYSEWNMGLKTEMGVPFGAERSFGDNRRYPPDGFAEVALLNAPDCDQYWFTSNSSSVGSPGHVPSRVMPGIMGESTDCFLSAHPLDSPPIGAWLRDVHVDDTDTLDFAEPGVFSPLIIHPILIPAGGGILLASLNNDSPSAPERDKLLFDHQRFEHSIPDTLFLHGPDIDIQEQRTYLSMFIVGYPHTDYTMTKWGSLPSAFTKMDGQLSIAGASPDSFAFASTGSWESFQCHWSQELQINSMWFIEGPSSIQSFSLPRFPPSFTDLFPDYVRQGYELDSIEIFTGSSGDLIQSQGIFIPVY